MAVSYCNTQHHSRTKDMANSSKALAIALNSQMLSPMKTLQQASTLSHCALMVAVNAYYVVMRNLHAPVHAVLTVLATKR